MSDAERYTQIIGGRPLSDGEKARINAIKAKGQELLALLYETRTDLMAQHVQAHNNLNKGTVKLADGMRELERLKHARPDFWIGKAIDEAEVAVMFAVRSIAQPEF